MVYVEFLKQSSPSFAVFIRMWISFEGEKVLHFMSDFRIFL